MYIIPSFSDFFSYENGITVFITILLIVFLKVGIVKMKPSNKNNSDLDDFDDFDHFHHFDDSNDFGDFGDFDHFDD